MRPNKFGNYKLFRTLGEGAFAKVKRNFYYFLLSNLIFKFSWYSRKNWTKNSCQDFAKE